MRNLLPASLLNNNSTGRVSGIVELNIPMDGQSCCFAIEVADPELSLAGLVPLARELAEQITRIKTAQLNERQTTVPCRKGCAACCNYLVPLSVPEALVFAEELDRLPPQQSGPIKKAVLESSRKILESTRRGCFDADGQSYDAISGWYNSLGLVCPFLTNNICSNYQNRPIACREHLVVGSSDNCSASADNRPRVVKLPVSILDCLAKLSAELEKTAVESVAMPLALAWANQNRLRLQKKWPARLLIERFRDIIERSCTESAVPLACNN